MYINITKVNNDNKLTILYINIDIVVYMIFCSQYLQASTSRSIWQVVDQEVSTLDLYFNWIITWV